MDHVLVPTRRLLHGDQVVERRNQHGDSVHLHALARRRQIFESSGSGGNGHDVEPAGVRHECDDVAKFERLGIELEWDSARDPRSAQFGMELSKSSGETLQVGSPAGVTHIEVSRHDGRASQRGGVSPDHHELDSVTREHSQSEEWIELTLAQPAWPS